MDLVVRTPYRAPHAHATTARIVPNARVAVVRHDSLPRSPQCDRERDAVCVDQMALGAGDGPTWSPLGACTCEPETAQRSKSNWPAAHCSTSSSYRHDAYPLGATSTKTLSWLSKVAPSVPL
jgi:hypothetical protein